MAKRDVGREAIEHQGDKDFNVWYQSLIPEEKADLLSSSHFVEDLQRQEDEKNGDALGKAIIAGMVVIGLLLMTPLGR